LVLGSFVVSACEGTFIQPSLCLRGGAYSGKFEEVTKPSDVILRDHKTKVKNPPTELETKVAEKLFEGMKSNANLRMLKYLHIMSVREVLVPETEEKALVLIVPFIEMKEYRKIQEDLQKYVEENFQAHMVLIQHRRILPKEKQGHRLHKQKRPMSRTLSFVHKAWLDDIIHPHDICAEHQVFSPHSEKPTFNIYLDPKVREQCEHKLGMFSAVYKHLTGKVAVFAFLQLREGSELQKQRCPNRYPCDTAGFTITEVAPKPLLPPEGEGAQHAAPRAIEAEQEEEEEQGAPMVLDGGEGWMEGGRKRRSGPIPEAVHAA